MEWADGKVLYERGLAHSELSVGIPKDFKKCDMEFVGTTAIYVYRNKYYPSCIGNQCQVSHGGGCRYCR